MALLRGFSKRTGEGQASSDQMLRIMEKVYLNRTPGGEFQNEADVQGLIDTLNNMPQTPDVMEKVAELENMKLKFSTRQNDMMTSTALFRDNLNDALRVEAKDNYKNLGVLVGGYMDVYADAEEKIDQYINQNVYERYGTSATPPQDLIQLKNEIKEKARYYSTLTALLASPEGASALNVEGLAVKVRTNPLTGNIISLDVVPRGEVNGKESDNGYMQTDIKAKIGSDSDLAIPIYINADTDKTTALGTSTKYGRLGSMEFRGVDKLSGGADEQAERQKELGDGYGVGQLKAQNEQVGILDWLNVFSDSEEESANKGLDAARESGMTFNDFNFDGNDIPAKSITRKGNSLYFQQENGDLSEFDGKNYSERVANAKNYLTKMGLDPNKANTPLYADDVYFIGKDGTSKIKEKIGADYFTAPLPTSPTTSIVSPSASSTAATTTPSALPETSSSFFSNTNRPNKPNTKTTTTTPSFIEKGKGFFRQAFGG